jgi:hypothetical protein
MTNLRSTQLIQRNGNTIITIADDQNMAPMHSWTLPISNVCSYTVPGESIGACAPLSEGAVRLGNSLLSSFVPEHAILRDSSEDF